MKVWEIMNSSASSDLVQEEAAATEVKETVPVNTTFSDDLRHI